MSELEEAKEDDVILFLKLLGLNLYEARAYVALLSQGSVTSNSLHKIADIPQPRTYDTLDSLMKKGFANFSPTAERSYNPVTPQLLRTFLPEKKMALMEKRNELQKQLTIADEKLSLLDKAEEMVSKLSALYQARAEKSEVVILDGINAISSRLKELIATAEKYVVSTSKLPILHPVEPIFEQVLKAIENGTMYKRILGSSLLLSEGLKIVEEDIGAGVQLKWLPEEQLHEKFYVVDDKHVLIRLREPSTGVFTYTSVYIASPSLAQFMKNAFDELWQKAYSPLELINELRSRIPKNLGKEEAAVFKTLLEYGSKNTSEISQELRLNKQKVNEITEKLLRKKLIEKNPLYNSYIINFSKLTEGYA
jgi:sugar-specific transcriptional regulator TrmB